MKKWLSLLLAALMVLGSVAALAEAANTYALTEETFTLEQGPVWYFMYFDEATGELNELHATPAWGDNWQFSENPDVDQVYHSICEWDGVRAMAGTWLGKHIDIVVAFKAPKAGKITIGPMTFDYHEDALPDDAYFAKIIKRSGEEQTYLLGTQEAGVELPVMEALTTEAIEVEVAEGDFIGFMICPGNDGDAAIRVEPTLTYAE